MITGKVETLINVDKLDMILQCSRGLYMQPTLLIKGAQMSRHQRAAKVGSKNVLHPRLSPMVIWSAMELLKYTHPACY